VKQGQLTPLPHAVDVGEADLAQPLGLRLDHHQLVRRVVLLQPVRGQELPVQRGCGRRDVLQVEEGSLYPALQRLAINGWVRAEWGQSDNNRRARFYHLTAGGRKQLKQEAAAFERIVDAQGRRDSPIEPSRFVRPVKAARSGVVTEINSWTIAGIARRAGAPMDKSAGVDLLCRESAEIRSGEPIYLVHAGSETDLVTALADAEQDSGYTIA